jgi:non-canonical (house-cleaning) NTP pyrophosphatase
VVDGWMVIVVENEAGEKRRGATRRVENTGTFESMYRIAGLEAGCFRRASPYSKYLLFNLLFERGNIM